MLQVYKPKSFQVQTNLATNVGPHIAGTKVIQSPDSSRPTNNGK